MPVSGGLADVLVAFPHRYRGYVSVEIATIHSALMVREPDG